MLKKKKFYLITILGFLSIIIVGAMILSLPVCNNTHLPIMDAFFIATSAVCVNGFTTFTISEQFTGIGQFILLLLVEIGALGFMSFIVFILTIRNKKMSISDILLAGDSIKENVYSNVRKRILNIFKYTFIIQLIGTILLSLKFIPMYGMGEGLWCGLFHSATAFCNAGFDIIGGTDSLRIFNDEVYVNIVIIVLMFLGGIGFFVIEDIWTCFKKSKLEKISFQTKIVLSTSLIVLVISLILIKIFEPNISFLEDLFTSLALRTTGFTTIDFSKINVITKFICCIFMFIGGAPGSTSGGIRENVVAILCLVVSATLREKREVVVFYRRIDQDTIRKAVTIVILGLIVILIGTILLLHLESLQLEDTAFHVISAFSEVGISYVDLGSFNQISQLVLMFIMFIGRVGPIAILSIFLVERKERQDIGYPDANIIL